MKQVIPYFHIHLMAKFHQSVQNIFFSCTRKHASENILLCLQCHHKECAGSTDNDIKSILEQTLITDTKAEITTTEQTDTGKECTVQFNDLKNIS